MSGFGFSTWASRIPSIKALFDFNAAELGNVLLAMPVSSLIGLPFSGWLVSRFESRIPLLAAYFFFSTGLVIIGLASDIWILIGGICMFSFSMRIVNIAMNTQSITLQKSYTKKIIGSFHGIWSSGGVAGILFSTLMIRLDIPMEIHMAIVAIVGMLLSGFASKYLLREDRSPSGNKLRMGKPDKFILYLGLLLFFAALCEGGMFDWSGVYFREVIGEDLFTLGYLIFMCFMALSRFFSDRIISYIGMPRTFIMSTSLVVLGIFSMILFPSFWPAVLGFSLVGIGVAAVVPMVYALAGTSEKYSAGMAISIIATYGIIGMLLGPPLVGYLAHLFNLRIAFILFILAALMFIPISRLFFKNHES